MVIFVPQYYAMRDECLSEWGDAADWCSVTVYHSDGIFSEPTCGCRVIIAPNCDDGLNKTLPGEVFEKLGSNVTIAVYGGFCNLVGPIPDEIGGLSNLELLYLYKNQLSGPIPASFRQLEAMKFLSLGVNELIGEIPASLGNMNWLEFLDLSDNKLEGGIPYEILLLMGQRLWEIALQNNNLTGNVTLNLGMGFFIEQFRRN